VYLHPDLQSYFSSATPLFDQIMALSGESFRQQDGRSTLRIVLGNKSYFIKQHRGVGWREIFKNLVQLRLPILSARNEWRAIHKLETLGVQVPRVVGFGVRGWNPAALESFVIMEDITPAVSLETLTADWNTQPPSLMTKWQLIDAVATIARELHEHGINHRDFYLCHFLLRPSHDLYLIDLHRATLRRSTPQRWIIKDLAGLYFSSQHIKLTQRDLYRFMRTYRQSCLHSLLLRSEKSFWQKVLKRGSKYRDHTQSV
jgi:heptose I phosphotransferase